jgi:triacylglycerol lipase
MAKLVLAHGILGFGEKNALLGTRYFNGVRPLFERAGFEVLEPTVAALGNLDSRSTQLATQIAAHWPDDSPIWVIGHSMGGLDARRVIARHPVGRRITRLITIATPHFGSPVADALLAQHSSLLPLIPTPWRLALLQSLAALPDLTLRDSLQDTDQPWVQYHNIVCRLQDKPLHQRSPVYALAQAIGQLGGPDPSGDNDGVVTCHSASGGQTPWAVWSGVDHGDAIGWPTGYWGMALIPGAFSAPEAHLARYQALIDRL